MEPADLRDGSGTARPLNQRLIADGTKPPSTRTEPLDLYIQHSPTVRTRSTAVDSPRDISEQRAERRATITPDLAPDEIVGLNAGRAFVNRSDAHIAQRTARRPSLRRTPCLRESERRCGVISLPCSVHHPLTIGISKSAACLRLHACGFIPVDAARGRAETRRANATARIASMLDFIVQQHPLHVGVMDDGRRAFLSPPATGAACLARAPAPNPPRR